uniref:transposase n=1 Tax=Glaciecola sp. SC05 TaxID=1987355 RepID=UPI00352790E4
KPRQSKRSKVHARGATDPWLLATSLPRTKCLAKKVVAIYRMRMQIEEEFRDIKSSLFGLGFEHHKSRRITRIAILILIATLASILANIIGLAMHIVGLHRRYQANTTSTRRVLSFHYLGLRGYVDKRLGLFVKQYEAA